FSSASEADTDIHGLAKWEATHEQALCHDSKTSAGRFVASSPGEDWRCPWNYHPCAAVDIWQLHLQADIGRTAVTAAHSGIARSAHPVCRGSHLRSVSMGQLISVNRSYPVPDEGTFDPPAQWQSAC